MDSFSAVRTLHDAGHIHGNISTESFGFNQNKLVFQLRDFSNSRSIENAKNYVYRPKNGFLSRSYRKTGLYTPLDDYIGVFKLLVKGLTRYLNLKKALQSFDVITTVFELIDDEDLMLAENINDWFLFKAFRTYWRYSHDPNDPSIKGALPLLKQMAEQAKTI